MSNGWLLLLRWLSLLKELVCFKHLCIQVSLILEESIDINCCFIKEHSCNFSCKLLSERQFNLRINAVTNELLLFSEIINIFICGCIILRKDNRLDIRLLHLWSRLHVHHRWELLWERRASHTRRHLLRELVELRIWHRHL